MAVWAAKTHGLSVERPSLTSNKASREASSDLPARIRGLAELDFQIISRDIGLPQSKAFFGSNAAIDENIPCNA